MTSCPLHKTLTIWRMTHSTTWLPQLQMIRAGTINSLASHSSIMILFKAAQVHNTNKHSIKLLYLEQWHPYSYSFLLNMFWSFVFCIYDLNYFSHPGSTLFLNNYQHSILKKKLLRKAPVSEFLQWLTLSSATCDPFLLFVFSSSKT